MNDAPPMIKPPVMPPPLPAGETERALQQCITRCKVLCIIAASLFLAGLAGCILQYVEEGTFHWGAFLFGAWYVAMGYGAAMLLHRCKRAAYAAAIPCFIVMLLLIPVGTVFGILGLTWLNKGRPLLTQV